MNPDPLQFLSLVVVGSWCWLWDSLWSPTPKAKKTKIKCAELGLIPKSQSGSRYGRRDISLAAHRDGTRELRQELGAREIYLSLIFQVNKKGGLGGGFAADTFLAEARHHQQHL